MYDPKLSQSMAAFCELTYVQYDKGLPPPANNGQVTLPPGFTQIASFTAPEVDISSKSSLYKQIRWQDVTGRQDLQPFIASLTDVYFGFAATSANYNVIALRGTQSIFEWILDIDVPQVPVPLGWFNNGHFEWARVHMGFLIFYALLVEQVTAACKQFDKTLPCLVTGHSLGAALATLMAPTITLFTGNSNVQMYNYASPRVGNPAFADAYDLLIPQSYRVVNLGDLVPMVPPTDVVWQYQHVQQEWSFLNQSGNIAGNHALIGPDNYTDAVNLEIPTNAARTYPVTGL